MRENEQLCLTDLDYHTRKNGKTDIAPPWIRKERCENCVEWERLPEADQPADGWGVKGVCRVIHNQKQEGYEKTSAFSYCQDFKSYGEQ